MLLECTTCGEMWSGDDESQCAHCHPAPAPAPGASPEERAKDQAYAERNQLVALLAAIFPSWRTTHDPNDTASEPDWRTIIGVALPTGQATWHIHDSEVERFAHVPCRHVPWDGHTTEEKYDRVRAAIALTAAPRVPPEREEAIRRDERERCADIADRAAAIHFAETMDGNDRAITAALIANTIRAGSRAGGKKP